MMWRVPYHPATLNAERKKSKDCGGGGDSRVDSPDAGNPILIRGLVLPPYNRTDNNYKAARYTDEKRKEIN